MTYDWQKLDRSFRDGIKKGDAIIVSGRRMGKSKMVAEIMRMKFTSSWTKWKREWSWKPRVSSRSGKMIWGNVMIRENKFVLSNYGRKIIQRATPKEAYTEQKEEFKRALS